MPKDDWQFTFRPEGPTLTLQPNNFEASLTIDQVTGDLVIKVATSMVTVKSISVPLNRLQVLLEEANPTPLDPLLVESGD